jgi:bifunctional DNA-binding transcriptional regulator/antitoxin component of YhaV-PrlF toxin-antitoxin module
MRITSKGQVTIPLDIRRRAGFLPGTDVLFVMDGEDVRHVKPKAGADRTAHQQQFDEWLKKVKGTATTGLTTEEIMSLTRGPTDGRDPGRL